MNRLTLSLLAVLVAFFSVAPVARAESDAMKELQKHFQERLPAVQKLKAAGLIGETNLGYLDARETVDADAQKLIKDENADRYHLFQMIADQEGVKVDKVAERAARRNFQKAKSGEYLKTEDGWKKKA